MSIHEGKRPLPREGSASRKSRPGARIIDPPPSLGNLERWESFLVKMKGLGEERYVKMAKQEIRAIKQLNRRLARKGKAGGAEAQVSVPATP